MIAQICPAPHPQGHEERRAFRRSPNGLLVGKVRSGLWMPEGAMRSVATYIDAIRAIPFGGTSCSSKLSGISIACPTPTGWRWIA